MARLRQTLAPVVESLSRPTNLENAGADGLSGGGGGAKGYG